MKRMYQLSPLLLIIAAVGDFSLPYVLGPFYPGFNQTTTVISALGAPSSPVQPFFNYSSIITGSLFILGAIGLPFYFKESKEQRFIILLSVAIGCYGLFDCILSGLVVADGHEAFFDPIHFFHSVVTGVGMLGMMFVPFLSAIRAWQLQQKKGTIFFGACFIFCSLSLLLFASYYLPIIGPFLTPTRGLWQRLGLFFLYLPTVAIALRTYYEHKQKKVFE